MGNGTDGPTSPVAIRERTVDGLHKPIQRIVRAGDRVQASWGRRDLAALEQDVPRLRVEIETYLAELGRDGRDVT